MENLKQFIGLTSVSKTIRNELIPVPETKKYIEENHLIIEDELRNEKSREVKEIADDYYRDFIARKLSDVRNIDWIQLFDLMKVCKADPSKDNKKALSEAQETARKQLCAYFSNSEEFNKLFCAKLFTDLLPNFINSNEEYSAEEKIEKVKTVELFNRFYTYFEDFLTSRENMFSAKEQTTAIGYRVINENAVIFLDNLKAYSKIKELVPQEISKIEQESSEEFENWTMDQIFTPYFYGMFTTQENIAHFNKICGVINQHMNLYCQQTKEKSGQFRMRKLHKQILSETISLFEVPHKFEDDAEVLNAVNVFITNANDKNIFGRLRNIVKSINNYDFNKIYVAKDSYARVSSVAFGRWNVFRECLEKYYDAILPGKSDTKAKKKKIEKAVNDDLYKSINDFDMIVNHYHTDSEKGSAKEIISEILKIIPAGIDTVQAATRKISEDDRKIDEIKEKLDVFINVLRWTKSFQVNENLDLDASFYSEVENINDELEDIVPLYNKVRNYVTKKPFSLEKMKLNFNCPSLGSGWSKSKEFENNCTILMRDGKYYLMIFNALNKPKKKEFITAEKPSSDKDYKKMTYSLLPNAYMSFPHIFFSDKWLEENDVPDYIIKGYNQKRHIKSSETFDIKFCRDLIDYFKDCINKYPEYDVFKFKFSDTDSYNNISEFYREADEQGYTINWSYIKEETINTFVESGKVFLFQIYNKDFSEKSTGKKNLHTMYFENLFSEENLRNTVLRLNGGAEIFFRKSSIKTPVIHKKGTVYVNKTICGKDINGSEIRIPIPDDIYMNIYNHYNKGTELSSEAEALINTGKVEFKDVEKEITKDYRYTVDKFFLHLPILINGKAYSKKTVNDLTLQYIKENDINVLGICRGSNNMLYASVINQNGELIEQKSFDVVHNFDYKKKLDDRERSMDSARKNWKEIGKIKELEEGYLSNVVHEVVKLMMKYNAIIALEDTSVGKRKTKLDARVFQKFQTMLINKLNYLTSKDIPVDEDGGLLRGYQLAYIPENLSKLGRQCGFLFFTASVYTNIDPTTGFVSLFDFKEIRKNNSSKLNFLLNFDEIAYDSNKHMFKFAFDYTKMTVYKNAPSLPNNKWTVYTNGTRMQRVYSDNKVNYKYEKVDITSHLIKVLCEAGINYSDGHNLLTDLNKMYKDDKLVAELFEAFNLTVQMRNTIPELQEDGTTTNYDRFVSPVLNNEGNFFDTYNYNDTDSLPCCADALTAYCIALKGLYEVKQIKANWTEENFDRETLKLTTEDWLDFITTKKI